jgi:hypothetical protein
MLTHCCNQRFYATVISTYVPNEYPKWVNGVLVRNAEAKLARREALAEALAAARAAEPIRPPSPAGIRMRRTRERRREGKMSIAFDISVAQIEALGYGRVYRSYHAERCGRSGSGCMSLAGPPDPILPRPNALIETNGFGRAIGHRGS